MLCKKQSIGGISLFNLFKKKKSNNEQLPENRQLLLATVITGCGVLLTYLIKLLNISQSLSLSVIVGAVLAIYFMIFREDYKTETEHNANQHTILDEIGNLRNILTDNAVNTYKDRCAGLKHCIELCEDNDLYEVDNTVLYHQKNNKYNKDNKECNDEYSEWVKQKQITMERPTKVIWRELISSQMDIETINKYINPLMASETYHRKFIDDKTYPMIQVTLFAFSNNEMEVIFGWSYMDTNEHGVCFSTRNKKVTTYFKDYFLSCWGNKEIARDRRYNIINIDKDICYTVENLRGLLPGIWFYVLSGHPKIKNVYGIITIQDTGDNVTVNRYMADGDVYYRGNGHRGTWSSRNMSFDDNNQHLHIHYTMDIKDPKPDQYIGALYIQMEDNKEKIFKGQFYDIKDPDEKGTITITPYYTPDGERPQTSENISQKDREYYFQMKFNVDIGKMLES